MVGWSPYAIFALIKQYGKSELISPAIAVIPSLFAKVTICYNPIIYVGLNTQFRQAFNRFHGAKPKPNRIMTASTTANIVDADDVQTMRNKLQTANKHTERGAQEEAHRVNEIETIELNVM